MCLFLEFWCNGLFLVQVESCPKLYNCMSKSVEHAMDIPCGRRGSLSVQTLRETDYLVEVGNSHKTSAGSRTTLLYRRVLKQIEGCSKHALLSSTLHNHSVLYRVCLPLTSIESIAMTNWRHLPLTKPEAIGKQEIM